MYSPAAAKIPCICSHPGGASGCATAASAVTVIRKDAPKELRFTYWGSMAPPCCSIFRPFYNINWLPEDLQRADALFDADTQWWTFTELERYVALNYEKFAPGVKAKFRKLEEEFLDEAEYVESSFNGDAGILKEFSARAAKLSVDLARELTAEIKGKIKTSDIDRMLLAYFTESSAGCGMEYDKDIVK